MSRFRLGICTLVLATGLLAPVMHGAAQEGPTRTGGLGTVTTGVNAGPASQTDAGASGQTNANNPNLGHIPGVGLRPAATSTPEPFPGLTSGPSLPVAGAPAAPATTSTSNGEGTVPVQISTDTTGANSATDAAPPADQAPAADDSGGRHRDGDEGPAPNSGAGDAAPAAPAVDDGSTGAAPAPAPATDASGACGYPTWLDAQSALEKDSSLADTLDPDHDGIACEDAMY